MVIAQEKPIIATEVKTLVTLEEYRAIAETSEERYEYCNGEMIVMSGGTATHSAIAINILVYLGFLLRDSDFRLYNSDLRVWIPDYHCGTYADLMVVNNEPKFNGDRSDEILNPLLIVEILSPSTKAYDRGDKFRKYRSIPSFCEYLVVSQNEPYIEHYFRLEQYARWQLQTYDQNNQIIMLESLKVELPLSEIYRRIDFD
ncbi:MAG: Uma2 family endonuclease [Cyanobacteriota bacterium]|nr:Uma2 family endonuclease [Cyanobacteriota bacterium]